MINLDKIINNTAKGIKTVANSKIVKTAGKGIKKGMDKLSEMNAEQQKIYNEFQTKSDSQLMRYANGGNISRKMAAMKVLKERGYNV